MANTLAERACPFWERSPSERSNHEASNRTDFEEALSIESKQRAVCKMAQEAIYLLSYLKTQPFDCNGLDASLEKALKDWEEIR
jgi:hypothetical protein